MNYIKIAAIVIQLGLGGLFIYGGIQKFIPKERPKQEQNSTVKKELPDHIVKIKAFISGMKQTNYFWEFLSTVEIICGLLLVSQYLALLGAVMLVPLTLNIFLFHLFLEPHDVGELVMTGLYLLGNFFILAYNYPALKSTFLNFKSI